MADEKQKASGEVSPTGELSLYVSIDTRIIDINTGAVISVESERISKEEYELREQEEARIKREYEELKKALKRKRDLPAKLAQQTSREVRNAGMALSDGPSGRNWEPIAGETALRHALPGEPLQVKFLPHDTYITWNKETPATCDTLFQKLKNAGAPAYLCLQVILGTMLQDADRDDPDELTITIDEMIRICGQGDIARLSKAKRAELRWRYWEWLLLCLSIHVIGDRTGSYPDPYTKQKIETVSNDPLLTFEGKEMPRQMALDPLTPPVTVTLRLGKWLRKMRGNRQVLTDFGDVLSLASIPAGKLSGAWAQSIGLALNQKWRQASSRADIRRAGEDNHLTAQYPTMTRRELFELFRPLPEFDVFTILNGPNPKRAQDGWKKAIAILKKKHIGAYIEKTKLPESRRGWADAWLDQPLDIRPKAEEMHATAEIRKKAIEARRARTRKPAQK